MAEQSEQAMFILSHAMGQHLTTLCPILFISLNGKRVVALLDSGSSSSFINEQFALQENCQLLPVKARRIVVAGGGTLLSSAVVPHCAFQMAKLPLKHSFRVLNLPSHDVILGYDWFSLVSPVSFDVPQNLFSFTVQGKTTVTTSMYNKTEEIVEISAEHAVKMLDKGVQAFLIQLHNIVAETPEKHCIPVVVNKLLEDYKDVFAEPTKLPPQRALDHKIELLPGVTPPHSRPYRVPHHQKAEMKKQITHLLENNLTRHS